ncbi:MAG: hypothetical protein ACFFB3_07140 [Candidatus Hodarchaeota archaeon]
MKECSACNGNGRTDLELEFCKACYVGELYDLTIRALVKGIDVLTVEGQVA